MRLSTSYPPGSGRRENKGMLAPPRVKGTYLVPIR